MSTAHLLGVPEDSPLAAPDQQDMIEQTLAILASMMQQAAHDATLYCAEAKRTVIMPRDIELALKKRRVGTRLGAEGRVANSKRQGVALGWMETNGDL